MQKRSDAGRWLALVGVGVHVHVHVGVSVGVGVGVLVEGGSVEESGRELFGGSGR